MIGYFGLFDLGIGRALTVIIGRQAADAKTEECKHSLWAGVLITTITGLLGGVIMWGLAAPLTNLWLEIGLEWRDDARQAFVAVAFGVLPTTLTSALRGVLEGQGRFAVSNLIRLAFGVLMFALPALSFEIHGASLKWIAVYLVFARYIFLFASIVPLFSSLLFFPVWAVA